MTLRIEIEQLDMFSKVLNAAAAILEDEGTFVIRPQDGILLRNMDKGRFAMVDLKIHPSYFEGAGSFTCDKEYVIAVHMQDLKKVLQRARKDDMLTVELDENKEILKLAYTGRGTRDFILPLSAPEETQLPDPSELDFGVTAELVGGALSEIVRDVSIVGDLVTIRADAGKMIFSSSHDKKEVSVEMEVDQQGNSALTSISMDKTAESMYPTDYFKNIILVDNSFASAKLWFDSDKPLKLLYQYENNLALGYLLAPMQQDYESEEHEEEGSYDDDDDEEWEDYEDENEDEE
ncbi:MAG: hypothetical protein ACFFFG_18535 [Candidatus Thorarchaeota archaeon]